MKGKLTDIMECFNDDIDVLCIGESWLNEGIDSSELLWIGNTMYWLDRNTDRAGGLVTYIKNEHANYVTTVPEATFIHDDIEIQTFLIDRPMRKKKVICNIYRPNDGDRQNFCDRLETILELPVLAEQEVWIGGDYNIDFSKQKDVKFKAIEGFINTHNLSILVDQITRPESGTVIDNILTNAENIILGEKQRENS